MPQTITGFNNFVEFKKRRSSDVNKNFNMLRGSRLPINTDTATSSNNEHNLGSSDHIWTNGYFSGIHFAHTSITSRTYWDPNTAGYMDIKVADGVPGGSDTTTGHWSTLGYWGIAPLDIKYNTSTSANLFEMPYIRNGFSQLSATGYSTVGSVRINLKYGVMVDVGLVNQNPHPHFDRVAAKYDADWRNTSGQTNSGARFGVFYGATTSAMTLACETLFVQEGLNYCNGGANINFLIPSVGSGEFVFEVRARLYNGTFSQLLDDVLVYAYEL